jgi:hypothetical protein
MNYELWIMNDGLPCVVVHNSNKHAINRRTVIHNS